MGAPFGNNGEKKCFKTECAGSDYVKCPPDGVEVCPTWKDGMCHNWSNGTAPPWQLWCSPILTPEPKPVEFWCDVEESADGSFLCYVYQDVMMTGMTFTCTTGDCIYPSDCAKMPYLANGTRAQCLNEKGFEYEKVTVGEESGRIVNGTIVGIVTAVEWLRQNGWPGIASQLEESAGVADFNKYTKEDKIIFEVNSRLSRAQVAGISVGTLLLIALVILVAALLLYRQRKHRKLGDLKRTRERLQLALLESIPPSKCLGGDMCFVSTDIESSTVLRVHSLTGYDKAMQVHHNLLRQMLQTHGGVELLCEGDGFILGFNSVGNGTAFCGDFQQALQDVEWGADLQRVFYSVYEDPGGGGRGPGCLDATKTCAALSSDFASPSKKSLFNGLRVRCGVHWAVEGTFELRRSGPNRYTMSGPSYEFARRIGNLGHGGQTVLSKAAHRILMSDLQTAKYPIITDLGSHRLRGSTTDEPPEHLYAVAPSVGDLKRRVFGEVHTLERIKVGSSASLREIAFPNSMTCKTSKLPQEIFGKNAKRGLTFVGVFMNERKSFNEAIDRSRIPASAWSQVKEVVAVMEHKFWGWRVNIESDLEALSRGSWAFQEDDTFGEKGDALNMRQFLALSADFRAQVEAGEAWLLAFGDVQDAMRFCLSCSIELAYSPWAGFRAWRGRVASKTTDGVSLWSGPPLGFTMHTVARNAKGQGRQKTVKRDPEGFSAADWVWFSRTSQSLSQQVSAEAIDFDVGPGLLEALAVTQLIPANYRVILSGAAWESLNEGLGGQPARFGVVEHLGLVRMECLPRPWDMYQVLPVELAARTNHFNSLRHAVPGHLSLQSPGARDAPRPTAHLTFVFTRWFEPSQRDLDVLRETSARHKRSREVTASLEAELRRYAKESHIMLEETCTGFGGYVVEEIGLCEFLLAFPSPTSAVSFACTVQCGLLATVLRSALLQEAGLDTLRPLTPSEGQPGREDMGHERDKAFTGFLAAGVATVGSGPNQTWDRGLRTSGNGHPQRCGSESPSSRLSSSPRLRLRRQDSSTQAFARTHPVTGRCTYSTPAVNKAARALSRSRGGQVLLADLQCGVAGSDSGAQNRSIWKTSGRSGTSSISDLSASTDSALQVPPELTVATPAGPARTSLRTLGRAPLRGFPEAVPMAELVAELPPPPPLSRPQGGA